MSDWSRRRALRTITATGAFVLAGCSGEPSSSRSTPRDRGDPVPPAELDVLFVRDPGGEPLFDLESGADDVSTPEGGGIEGRPTRAEYLRDAASRNRVTFRSTPAAEELRTFVDGTDFESGSLYLLERPVSACYEMRLVGVYREDEGVTADLCQSFRPTGIACSASGIDTVGLGVRLSFPGDGLRSHDWIWQGECGTLRTVASERSEGSEEG